MRKKPIKWVAQQCFPRDFYDDCTLSIEQWMAGEPTTNHGESKWEVFMAACALVHRHVQADDGLRGPPNVGYDPIGDQPMIIFKASNNGTTYIVSPDGVNLGDVEIDPLPQS